MTHISLNYESNNFCHLGIPNFMPPNGIAKLTVHQWFTVTQFTLLQYKLFDTYDVYIKI
jgi:hypothetical protein